MKSKWNCSSGQLKGEKMKLALKQIIKHFIIITFSSCIFTQHFILYFPKTCINISTVKKSAFLKRKKIDNKSCRYKKIVE